MRMGGRRWCRGSARAREDAVAVAEQGAAGRGVGDLVEGEGWFGRRRMQPGRVLELGTDWDWDGGGGGVALESGGCGCGVRLPTLRGEGRGRARNSRVCVSLWKWGHLYTGPTWKSHCFHFPCFRRGQSRFRGNLCRRLTATKPRRLESFFFGLLSAEKPR
jgi:hypothetical protein